MILNREGHLAGGLSAPWVLVAFFLFIFDSIPFFHQGNALIGAIAISLAGIFGGVLPDILEPPTDPWHRGPFHYIGGVLCVISILVILINPSTLKTHFSTFLSWVILSLIAGYASHIILDILPIE